MRTVWQCDAVSTSLWFKTQPFKFCAEIEIAITLGNLMIRVESKIFQRKGQFWKKTKMEHFWLLGEKIVGLIVDSFQNLFPCMFDFY